MPSRVVWQISVRKKAGIDMRHLKGSDFQHSCNVYWVTSVESDDLLWLCVLPLKHQAVREFDARPPVPNYEWAATWQDQMDHWINLHERKAHPAESRGDRVHAGAAFPSALSEELTEIWVYARCVCPRAISRLAPASLLPSLTLTMPPSSLCSTAIVQALDGARRVRPQWQFFG
jgi:hypothetical protein